MTHEEIEIFEIVELSLQDPWYKYKEGGNLSSVCLDSLDINEKKLYEKTDPISVDLSFSWLNTLVSNSPLLVAANSYERKEVNLSYQVRYFKSK